MEERVKELIYLRDSLLRRIQKFYKIINTVEDDQVLADKLNKDLEIAEQDLPTDKETSKAINDLSNCVNLPHLITFFKSLVIAPKGNNQIIMDTDDGSVFKIKVTTEAIEVNIIFSGKTLEVESLETSPAINIFKSFNFKRNTVSDKTSLLKYSKNLKEYIDSLCNKK